MNVRVRRSRTLRHRSAVLLAAAVLVGGCGGPTVTITPLAEPPTASLTPSPTSSAAPHTPPPSATPSPSPTAQASCAERVLAGMSPSQRIGQLFLLGLAHNRLGAAELKAIREDHVGSVWFTARTSIGVAGVRAVADAIQAESTAAATANVRFFVAANQEGGLIQALAGPGFSTIPSAVVQGRQPVDTLTVEAKRWGRELLAAGVNLDFAPVSDVVPPGADTTNQPIGVLQREYGHGPLTAGSHAAAFIAGMTAAGVATTAKHFPGLGRVVANTDFAAGVVDSKTTISDPYLRSFQMAIAAGAPFVMVALATYTRIDSAHLAAFSSVVMTTLLREDLGFRGVIMSDSLTATAVAAIPAGQRAVDFLVAGGDLVVARSAQATAAMVAAVRTRAAADAGFAARLDDAALRILEAKETAGLLACSG